MPVVSKGGQTGIERIAANKLSRREDMALHGGVDVLPCRIFRKLEPRGVEREDHEPVVVPACVEERRTGAIVARARFARSRRAAAAVVVDANDAGLRRCSSRQRGSWAAPNARSGGGAGKQESRPRRRARRDPSARRRQGRQARRTPCPRARPSRRAGD